MSATGIKTMNVTEVGIGWPEKPLNLVLSKAKYAPLTEQSIFDFSKISWDEAAFNEWTRSEV